MSIKRRELKRSLTDRTMGIAVCCDTCKFCKKYFVYDDVEENETCIHLCFLDGDISPEDDEWLLETLQNEGCPWFYDEAPKEFRELLKLPEGEVYLEDSPRFVRTTEMCNHYLPEYVNRLDKNHDENELL